MVRLIWAGFFMVFYIWEEKIVQYDNEKDYIMRIIKEAVRVVFFALTGKRYTQMESEDENKYIVSGKKPSDYRQMVDLGKVNEAENLLLDTLDYSDKDEVAAAILFYHYVSEKGEDFLEKYNYSEEEALDGLKLLLEQAGYKDMYELIERR